MKAEPLLIRKRVYPNGDIVEIRAWIVAKSNDKPHGFKYSLFIRDGKRAAMTMLRARVITGITRAGSSPIHSGILISY